MPLVDLKMRTRWSHVPRLTTLMAATGLLLAASAAAMSATAASAAEGTTAGEPIVTVTHTKCSTLHVSGEGVTESLDDGALTIHVTDTRGSGEPSVQYGVYIHGETTPTKSIALNGGESGEVTLNGLGEGAHSVSLRYGDSGSVTVPAGQDYIYSCDPGISADTIVTQRCTDGGVVATVDITFSKAEKYYFHYMLFKGGEDAIDTTYPVAGGFPTATAEGRASFDLDEPLSEGVRKPLDSGVKYALVLQLVNAPEQGSLRIADLDTTTFTVKSCSTPSPEPTEDEVLTLSSQTVPAGGSVTITVSGAQPGELLTFELHSTVVKLGSAAADQNGDASLTTTIPATVPAGAHTVVVTGESTHVERRLTVTAAATGTDETTDPGSGDTGQTPSEAGGHKTPTKVQTDGDSSPMLALSVGTILMALLTAGGAALIRRRASN